MWASTVTGKNHLSFFNQNLEKMKTKCSNSLVKAYRNKIASTVRFSYGLDLMQEGADCGITFPPTEADVNRLNTKENKLKELGNSIMKCMSRSSFR